MPGSGSTYMIRALDRGNVIGSYYDNSGNERGFHRTGGALYLLDFPGGVGTVIRR